MASLVNEYRFNEHMSKIIANVEVTEVSENEEKRDENQGGDDSP